MSARTVGYFFISVNDSGGKLQESQGSPITEGAGRCWLSGITAWLWLAALLSGVFFTHQYLIKLIDFVRICLKRNAFLSVVVKLKANMSLKISLQWFG